MNRHLFFTLAIFFLIRASASYAFSTDTALPEVKKVMVVNYNPVIESQNNQTVTQVRGWIEPSVSENTYIQDIVASSYGVVTYQIVERVDVDEFPIKIDGFQYTDVTYFNCLNDTATCHSPDGVDYLKIFDDFDVCEKRNAGSIDEVWIWGGPYFGYWESNMAGPGAFNINGPVLEGTICEKQLPIMGFSYERPEEMLHNLGHRTEATMAHLYGGWSEDRIDHNWDRFGLVKAQSPNYAYSGCGSIHWAPNSMSDYDYSNSGNSTDSTCDNFLDYPNLTGATRSMNCSEWSCSSLGYYKWWFAHLPRFPGIALDGRLNNWWAYVLDYKEGLAFTKKEMLFQYAYSSDFTSTQNDSKTNIIDLAYLDHW